MTSTDVCNLALSYLGNTREISSMSEQSTEAILCQRFYNIARESLLKMFPWNFAVKQNSLTLVEDETDNTYAYVYENPNDCLRVLKVMAANDGGAVVNDYNVVYGHPGIAVRRIVSDVADAKISYIADIQDTEAMPSEFIDAFALTLANRLALPLSSSGQMAQAIQQQASIAVDVAKRMCAVERNQPLVKTNRYLDSRR